MSEQEQIVRVEDVYLRFGGVVALDGVSLKIYKGERVSLIGPNGSGKTSLCNCINGFYKPQRGRIIFEGIDVTRLKPHEIAMRGIGRTFQRVTVYKHESVVDNILVTWKEKFGVISAAIWFGKAVKEEEKAREKADEIIDFLELEQYRHRPVGSIPLAAQKLVMIGRALMLNPKLIIADELFGGLSYDEKYDVARFIMDLNEERGITFLLVEHDMEVVMDLSQRVMVMNQGKLIADGAPSVISREAAVIEAYLGV